MWEGVRCVGRSEVCRRGGGVWEGWKCVEGVRRVGGVEVCGRGGGVCVCVCGRGGVWWEGWCVEGVRCVGGGSMSVPL